VEFGFSGAKPFDFDIFPLHAGRPTGAERLERGLFGSEPSRKVDERICALRAVRLFTFRIYSIDEAVAELFQGLPYSIVLHDVDAQTNDHKIMLQVNRVSQITLLSANALSEIPGIVHAFSTRRADHNNFTLGPAADPLVQLNRARFLSAAGAAGWPLQKLNQCHSAIVRDMDDTWASNEPVDGDAAVTGVRGSLLGVQTADCVPVLIADRQGRAVAAVHAGWRGTAAHIVEATVARLQEKFGISPQDLVAVIGPHNAVCCYEVGDDVVEAIGDAMMFDRRPEWAKAHFNQARANRRQLIDSGIPESQIIVSNLCTYCRPDLFFSYRRDGKHVGRMLSVIGIQP
jgi:polyphenol oxidase